MAQEPGNLIQLGRIAAAHGLKGEVKIESYTENPRDIASFGALRDDSGAARFTLHLTGTAGRLLIARVDGCATREQAEKLQGQTLWLPRELLPPLRKGQTYHADLVGMDVMLESGERYGRIHAVHNFGAGDVIEITRTDGNNEMLPFASHFFPKIESEQRRVIISPPEYLSAGK
jgi:16S rRNA processing protein RimM